MTKKLLELMNVLKIKTTDVKDSIIKSYDDSYEFNLNFDNRLRLQKVVFLIEHNTKDFNYPFSLYLRGPYSKELAKDYYSMTEDSYLESEQPLSEEAKKLATILSEKDNIWLEIASTIVMFSGSYKPDEAVRRTKEFKKDVLKAEAKDDNYVDSVYEEIEKMNLL